MEMFLAFVLGGAAAFMIGRWWASRRGGKSHPSPTVFSSIEEMRSVGELSVFKLVTKEIVTAREHAFGEFGKRFFEWMVSSRKMAMVLSFEIDFRYDLRSSDFQIQRTGDRSFSLRMPKCFYDTRILDVHLYDEQSSKLMPWLLPDLLNRVFGPGFSEEDKNRLIGEAKREASRKAEELVRRMRSDVQKSTRSTMTAIARGFGATEVEILFRETEPVQSTVEYRPEEGSELAAAG